MSRPIDSSGSPEPAIIPVDEALIGGETIADREALLREIAAQRSTFDAVFAQMPAGMIILEAPAGRIVLYNPEAERLLGKMYAADEVSEYSRYGGEHADGSSYEADEYPSARALRGEITNQHRMRYRRPDGTIVHLSVSAAPVRDATGQIVNAVCSFVDITPQRIAELAVLERDERLRAALAASQTGTFRWDIESGALDWDENLDRLFGLEPGRTARSLDQFISLVHPEDRAHVIAACERCAATGADFDEQFRVVWPSGAVRWLRDKGRTYRAPDGRPSYMTGACVDIDAQVATTERLERLNALTERLSGAFTANDVAAVVVEQGMRALDAATGTLALVLADGETMELAGTMNSPDDIAAAWRRFPLAAPVPLAEVVRTGQSIFITGQEVVLARYPMLRDAATQQRVHAALVVPLAWDGRQLGSMSFTFSERRRFDEDVRAFVATIARQASQALERARLFEMERQARRDAEAARAEAQDANRAKGAFLAMMSHELRTPINAALGYVDLLLLGVRGELTGEQVRDLERVRRSQRSLLLLVNEVLDFARIDAGRIEYHAESLVLDELLADVAATVEPLAREGRLVFTVGSAEGLVVRGDRAKSQQILLNLLSNAVKFTPVGGKVSIECAAEGEFVRIGVRDTGRGIPPREIERIFEPFVQVDQRQDSTVRQGVGLGLAIARELARGMGGQLEVSSRVGGGSLFTLTLPRSTAGAADA